MLRHSIFMTQRLNSLISLNQAACMLKDHIRFLQPPTTGVTHLSTLTLTPRYLLLHRPRYSVVNQRLIVLFHSTIPPTVQDIPRIITPKALFTTIQSCAQPISYSTTMHIGSVTPVEQKLGHQVMVTHGKIKL